MKGFISSMKRRINSRDTTTSTSSPIINSSVTWSPTSTDSIKTNNRVTTNTTTDSLPLSSSYSSSVITAAVVSSPTTSTGSSSSPPSSTSPLPSKSATIDNNASSPQNNSLLLTTPQVKASSASRPLKSLLSSSRSDVSLAVKPPTVRRHSAQTSPLNPIPTNNNLEPSSSSARSPFSSLVSESSSIGSLSHRSGSSSRSTLASPLHTETQTPSVINPPPSPSSTTTNSTAQAPLNLVSTSSPKEQKSATPVSNARSARALDVVERFPEDIVLAGGAPGGHHSSGGQVLFGKSGSNQQLQSNKEERGTPASSANSSSTSPSVGSSSSTPSSPNALTATSGPKQLFRKRSAAKSRPSSAFLQSHSLVSEKTNNNNNTSNTDQQIDGGAASPLSKQQQPADQATTSSPTTMTLPSSEREKDNNNPQQHPSPPQLAPATRSPARSSSSTAMASSGASASPPSLVVIEPPPTESVRRSTIHGDKGDVAAALKLLESTSLTTSPTGTGTERPVGLLVSDSSPTIFDELGPLRDRTDLFRQKIIACGSVVFDFRPHAAELFIAEKEAKKQTLAELVDFMTNSKSVMTEQLMEDAVAMVSTNIFRALPPATSYNSATPAIHDIDEIEPAQEPAWPHLQLVYEFFLRCVMSNDITPKIIKKYIDCQFVLKFLDLFVTEDPRERDSLKTILHRIYGKLMPLRTFIRRAIQHVFYRYIYEDESPNGISELLEILGSIINGFALPLKDEHKVFLERSMIPLHKAKGLLAYSQQLSYCMTQYIEKEAKLAEMVITGLLKYWPITNTPKEITFLQELEEILEITQPAEFKRIMEPLMKRLALCIESPHFQTSERVLFLWNNEYVVKLINQNRQQLFPIIISALYKNTREHWNPTVHQLTLNVSKMLADEDPALFDFCSDMNIQKEERKRAEKLNREQIWLQLQCEYDEASSGVATTSSSRKSRSGKEPDGQQQQSNDQ